MSPETGTEAETLEETCSQACLLGLAQLLIQPCLAITQVTVDWTLPHHLAIQKSVPETLLQASQMEAMPQTRFCLPTCF